MLKADRDALLCDLAEVYHIYDMRALPTLTLAALSVGLRDDSRIKMKLAGMTYVSPLILLSAIADNLALFRYSMTAKKGSNPPDLYMDLLSGRRKPARMARAEKERDRKYVATRNAILEEARMRLEMGDNDG